MMSSEQRTQRRRKFIDLCGPVVHVVMFALAIWMLWQAGFSSLSLQLSAAPASGAATVGLMANAAMLIIAYFSAHLLNFGDFARSGKSEAAMKMGNLGIETYLPPLRMLQASDA
jgi:nucleobase:cation symporter-1, NCS1 family